VREGSGVEVGGKVSVGGSVGVGVRLGSTNGTAISVNWASIVCAAAVYRGPSPGSTVTVDAGVTGWAEQALTTRARPVRKMKMDRLRMNCPPES
jgi:tetrahydrodipicolinate N-succinyltransferase